MFVTYKKEIMNTSSKFVVALHILTGLAGKREYFCEGTVTSSKMLAGSVNTNPVVIRRILSMLNSAGLIISKAGPTGGAMLSKNSDEITLDQVYRAVNENDKLFHTHYSSPNTECPIGANIQTTLKNILSKTENLVEDYFATITLKEVMDDTFERSGMMEYFENGLSGEEIEQKIIAGEIKMKQS
jgi:Rrf2 family protein